MDILITGMIIAIIGLSVLPFFLLSSAFGAPKRKKDDGTGLVTPVPTDPAGPFPPKKKPDSDADDGGDGGDGDGGAD